MAGAFAAVRPNLAALPGRVQWRALWGCAWVGGIGFTMSLFIANLAFEGTLLLDSAKAGILAGSVVAGAVGGLIIRRAVVRREELQRRVWSADDVIDFGNGLNNAVNRLRTALGDDADKPRFIETLGRRGYRFIAPVPRIDDAPRGAAAASAKDGAGMAWMRLAVLPFRLLQPQPDVEFLAFSLPDAIAASLSGLESLAVRPRLAGARYGVGRTGFAGDCRDLRCESRARGIDRVRRRRRARVDAASRGPTWHVALDVHGGSFAG